MRTSGRRWRLEKLAELHSLRVSKETLDSTTHGSGAADHGARFWSKATTPRAGAWNCDSTLEVVEVIDYAMARLLGLLARWGNIAHVQLGSGPGRRRALIKVLAAG
jgi:hypothetical protein